MFEAYTITMKLTLFAGGGLAAALLLILIARRSRAPRAGDVGSISEQWLADHKRNGDEL